jgi:hypothetical protein
MTHLRTGFENTYQTILRTRRCCGGSNKLGSSNNCSGATSAFSRNRFLARIDHSEGRSFKARPRVYGGRSRTPQMGVANVSQAIDIVETIGVNWVMVGQLVGQTHGASGILAPVTDVRCACDPSRVFDLFRGQVAKSWPSSRGWNPYCSMRYPSHPLGLSWSEPGVPAGSA